MLARSDFRTAAAPSCIPGRSSPRSSAVRVSCPLDRLGGLRLCVERTAGSGPIDDDSDLVYDADYSVGDRALFAYQGMKARPPPKRKPGLARAFVAVPAMHGVAEHKESPDGAAPAHGHRHVPSKAGPSRLRIARRMRSLRILPNGLIGHIHLPPSHECVTAPARAKEVARSPRPPGIAEPNDSAGRRKPAWENSATRRRALTAITFNGLCFH